MQRRHLIAVLGLLALLLAACSGGAATTSAPTTTSTGGTTGGEGAALLQARCTACHSLDRVTSQQQPEAWWADTVGRMVGKGAQLSETERTTLIAYLAATYGP